MGLHVGLSGRGKFHGNQLVSLLLEAFDDFTDESTLDSVGLYHDVLKIERAYEKYAMVSNVADVVYKVQCEDYSSVM